MTEETLKQRLSTNPLEYARLLRDVDIFSGLDRVSLSKLSAQLQPEVYSAGTVIFRQGDTGNALYVLASGNVGVYLSSSEPESQTLLKILQPGEPFGEMALLNSAPRTATIVAESDCEVLRLDRSGFLSLVKEQPGVALSIAATRSKRLSGMLSGSDSAAAIPDRQPRASEPAPAAKPKDPAWWVPGRMGISLLAALAVFLLGWSVPSPSGLSLNGWHALVLLVAILPPLVLDTIPEGITALALACAWVLFGVTNTTSALSGFATSSWVLVVSVLIIGSAITQTGVLYRLALQAITYLRGGFPVQVSALAFVGQLIGPAVPNATSRVIIVAPMLRELVDALGYAPKSKAAAGLSMAVLIGFGQLSAATLTSGTTTVLLASLIPQPFRANIDWVSWTIFGASYNLIMLFGLLGTILYLYRPSSGPQIDGQQRLSSLKVQQALLGPMSHGEKLSLCVGVGLLFGFASEPIHHIAPGWIAAIAVVVLAAGKVATANTLRLVNWNFALLFGILISLASVFSSTGLDKWIAGLVSGELALWGSSRFAFVLILSLFCLAISFVVRWQAAAPLVTITLSPLAIAAGIHPFVVAVIAVTACNGFFLPYQSTTYLALEGGTNRSLFTFSQAFPLAVAFAIWSVLAGLLSVPYWQAMKLM